MKDKVVSDQNISVLQKWNQYYIYKENYLKSCKEKILVTRDHIQNKENKLEIEMNENLKIINENLNLAKKDVELIISESEKDQLTECRNLKNSIEDLETKYEILLNQIENETSSMGNLFIINIKYKT